MRNSLKIFYANVATTHELFQIIDEKNTNLISSEEIKIEKPNDAETNKELCNELIYIFAHTTSYKLIIIDLFKQMKEYEFNKIQSVSSDLNIGYTQKRYDYYREINLYDHTVHCVMETIDLLGNHTPPDAMAINIILAILHDFGKNPLISEKYKGDKDEKHHHISANFAKQYFHKNKLFNVSKEFIDLIYKTIWNHHEQNEKKSPFLKILIEADQNAREKEYLFITNSEREKVDS